MWHWLPIHDFLFDTVYLPSLLLLSPRLAVEIIIIFCKTNAIFVSVCSCCLSYTQKCPFRFTFQGTLCPDEKSKTLTLNSRLRALWQHVRHSRAKFEEEPDRGTSEYKLKGKCWAIKAYRVENIGPISPHWSNKVSSVHQKTAIMKHLLCVKADISMKFFSE